MSKTNFDVVVANQFVGAFPNASYGVSPFNKVIYVDGTNGSDGYSGLEPSQAFATLGQAHTVSVAGDKVVIAPGTYTITSALAPKARTTWEAAIVRPRTPTVTISGNIADVVQVDVDGLVFHGIEFKAAGNTADNLVDIADTTAVSGITFDSCVFNGDDKTSVVGINLADASNATSGLVVRNCLFRDLTGICLNVGALGMPYAEIVGNQFAIDVNSGTGIAMADTTAFATGKAYKIVGNTFTGFDATADEVGITIAGTENTTGAGIIAYNLFAFTAAAAITADKVSQGMVNNYAGDAGTGGTIVDAGTA